MALKLLRAAWFVSVLIVLANLLFVYASLPENVVVQEEGGKVALSREWIFYIATATILLINVMVYVFKTMFSEQESLRAWFHGLVITMNIFIVVAMQALNVYNSAEVFDHSLATLYLTGSLTLILLVAVSWPVYLLLQKIFFKEAIS